MKQVKPLFLMVFLIACGFTAKAELTTEEPQSSLNGAITPNTAASADLSGITALFDSGVYRFTQTTPDGLTPNAAIVDGELVENTEQVQFSTNKDESVHVASFDDNQLLLTYFLPANEIGVFPSQVIVSRSEFQKLNMQFVAAGPGATLSQYENGYQNTEVARLGHGGGPRAWSHGISRGGRAYHLGGHRGGNYLGHSGNCVAVVSALSGNPRDANGGAYASRRLSSRRYHIVSFNARRPGTICSWAGHARGHVGYFDGNCFQPVYPTKTFCGDPGSGFRLSLCVAPN